MPGNAGIAQEAECLPVDLAQTKSLVELAKRLHADLTIVGPELLLVAGIVNDFEKEGLAIIGPNKAAVETYQILCGTLDPTSRLLNQFGKNCHPDITPTFRLKTLRAFPPMTCATVESGRPLECACAT